MNGKTRVTLWVCCIIFNSPVYAQLLTEVVSRFDTIDYLAYRMTLKQKDLFSDKIFTDTLHADFALSRNKELFKITGTTIQEIYDGNKLIKLDLNTHTYRIANNMENSIFQHQSLPYIVNSLKENIRKGAPVRQLNDSILNGRRYYHVEITELDTIKKDRRVFRIVQALFDRESYFPVYYRIGHQGFVDGTDIFVDTYSEIHFYEYHVNQKERTDFSTFVIPSTFVIEESKRAKPLLTEGTQAPELDLKDTKGNVFRLKGQKGKVVLLNFTTSSCPHSIESIGMLNTLFSRYGRKNFAIVTINPFDDKESIEMYNRKGNIKYPVFVYMDTDNTGRYNVDSYPTFYLIDKSGKVIRGFSGYYQSLEEELNRLIKKHL